MDREEDRTPGKDAVVGSADAVVSRVTGAVPDAEQVKTGAGKSASRPSTRSA